MMVNTDNSNIYSYHPICDIRNKHKLKHNIGIEQDAQENSAPLMPGVIRYEQHSRGLSYE